MLNEIIKKIKSLFFTHEDPMPYYEELHRILEETANDLPQESEAIRLITTVKQMVSEEIAMGRTSGAGEGITVYWRAMVIVCMLDHEKCHETHDVKGALATRLAQNIVIAILLSKRHNNLLSIKDLIINYAK